MLNLYRKIKDCFASLRNEGQHDEHSLDALRDIEDALKTMEQSLEDERIRHQACKDDNERLYAENKTLKTTIAKMKSDKEALKKENTELQAAFDEKEAQLAQKSKEYKDLLESSTIIVNRMQKVAFGKKGEKLWKILGKKTKTLFEGFVATVNKNPGTNEPSDSIDGNDADNPTLATQQDNGTGVASTQQDNGTGAPTAPTQQDNGTSAPTAPTQQDNGTGAPTAPTQQDNGTGAPTAPTQQDNGTSAPTVAMQQDNGTGAASAQQDNGTNASTVAAQQGIGTSAPTASAQQNNGTSTPTASARQDNGTGAASNDQVVDNNDGDSDADTEKRVIKRLKGFLHEYSCHHYAFSFMPFGRTATEMMDDYGIDYKEQRLWLISRGLLFAENDAEEKEAEKLKDKPFGHLIGRATYYPVLERRFGIYYPCICIVPEVTHNGSTLAGRHSSRLFQASNASPALIGHVGISKFRQGLPYNVISNDAIREGAKISRSRLADWLIRAYDEYLWVFHEYLRQLCVKRGFLMMDETFGYAHGYEAASPQFYFWGMCTSPLTRNLPLLKVYYQDKNRYGLIAAYLLRGFKGFLEADGFDGYEWLDSICEDIILCSDWTHSRRKFVESLPAAKILEQMTDEELKELKGLIILNTIASIFHLEKEFVAYDPDERLMARQGKMKELIEKVVSLCEEMAAEETFDPSTEIGKAVMYVLDRKISLARLLEDGTVTLSTNEIERSNIIIALVRKRAKYYGSERGAKSAAGYFSIIESAEANNADPELFLEFLMTVLPHVMREHENEVQAYKVYLEKVRKILEDARELHRKNPNAKIVPDWSEAGPEPSLEFLSDCFFDKDAFKAFVAMRKQEDEYLADALIRAKTEFNFKNSPVSPEGMQKLLNTPAFADEPMFDGAREILGSMPEVDKDDPTRARFRNGLVKNLSINDTPYPERLLEMMAERGLSINPTIPSKEIEYATKNADTHTIPLAAAEAIDQGSAMPCGPDLLKAKDPVCLLPIPGPCHTMAPPCPEGPIALMEGKETDAPGCGMDKGNALPGQLAFSGPPPGELPMDMAARPSPS